MSESEPRTAPPVEPPPQARTRAGFWPGLVWAIPLAAMLVTGYLALTALANRGFDVVVTFESAAGARPDDTKVVYKGLEVGHVAKIVLNKDAHHVDMTLRLDRRLKSAVTTGTQFWLIGASPNFTDLNSLKAAVAGLSIGMAPGPGEPTRHRTGLEEEPLIAPGAPGREFLLDTNALGAIRRGSTVIYHGFDAGRVTAVKSTGLETFQVSLFVQAPFDRFVRPSSLFWDASSLRISLDGGGITGQLASPATAFSGGVAFQTPLENVDDPPSPRDAHFILYSDLGRARQGPDGPEVLYDAMFRGTAGDLAIGAPVTLGGARIGVVTAVGLSFDPMAGTVSNPITFAVYPERLHIKGAGVSPNQDWRPATNAALQTLLRLGFRVRLDQSPPLIGSKNIGLDRVKGAALASLNFDGPRPRVPSVSDDDGNALTDQAGALLAKLNTVPIEAIGRDVRQIADRLSTLAGSPKVDDGLKHLDSTLASIDQILTQVKPQIGPLIGKLDQAAAELQATAASAHQVLNGDGASQDASLPDAIRQLSEAARAIRALADYLGRHPEAVIRGKAKDGK